MVRGRLSPYSSAPLEPVLNVAPSKREPGRDAASDIYCDVSCHRREKPHLKSRQRKIYEIYFYIILYYTITFNPIYQRYDHFNI